MSAHRIDCWKCASTLTLEDIAEADGLCPRCDADIDLAGYLSEALTARDAALAELAALKPFCEYCGGNDEFPQDHCMDCTRPAGDVAALKGGQEAVAMIRYARGVPGFENEMPHVVSCNDLPDGLYPVYLAPPAQASAWVPEGWKLVPERMHLDSSDIETIQAHCGDGQEDAGFGPYSNGVLWIGECEEEDGSKTYGLHIATADYPEEGSSTLVEFAAAPTPGASDGKGGDV